MVVDHLGGDQYSLHSNWALMPLSPGYDYKFSVKCDFPRWDPARPADRPEDSEMQNACSSLGGKIGNFMERFVYGICRVYLFVVCL